MRNTNLPINFDNLKRCISYSFKLRNYSVLKSRFSDLFAVNFFQDCSMSSLFEMYGRRTKTNLLKGDTYTFCTNFGILIAIVILFLFGNEIKHDRYHKTLDKEQLPLDKIM